MKGDGAIGDFVSKIYGYAKDAYDWGQRVKPVSRAVKYLPALKSAPYGIGGAVNAAVDFGFNEKKKKKKVKK